MPRLSAGPQRLFGSEFQLINLINLTDREQRLRRRTGCQVEVTYLQLGRLISNASIVDDEIVGNDQLILRVTAEQCTVNVLLTHLTFLVENTHKLLFIV